MRSHATALTPPPWSGRSLKGQRKAKARPIRIHDLTPIGDTASLVVWNLATGHVVRTIEEKQASQHDVVLSPDGSLLAIWDVSGPQHDVAVWAVNDGTLVGRFPSTRSVITSVAFGATRSGATTPRASPGAWPSANTAG